MKRIRKGKKRNTPKRGVLSNYKNTPIGKKGGANLPRHRLNLIVFINPVVIHAPAGKKGGVNLPRHRVELYITHKTGCKKCSGRKKRRSKPAEA
ncbi:MAG: hypothetical protein D3922_17180 [Candidatus Electrothrix sp. AR1]|nr:hypothetical protein [Candidatus Electrothrix sp. AR1]